MIVLDIETTGLDPIACSMVSLGAVDFENGDEFYCECQIYPDSIIEEDALKINGFTREQCVDSFKFTPGETYLAFVWWASNNRATMLAGQQVGSFDIKFLQAIAKKENVAWPFGHRCLDLHSVAYAKFKKSLSLDGILQELGMQPEPKPHNALTGAMVEYQAFKQLLA